MLVSKYELIGTKELANSLLDVLLNKEPQPAKRHIGLSFAEVMQAEGLVAAKAFVKRVKEDSTQRDNYVWDEDRGGY